MGIGSLRYLFDEYVFDDGPPGHPAEPFKLMLALDSAQKRPGNNMATRSRYFRYSSPKNATRSRSSSQMPTKM